MRTFAQVFVLQGPVSAVVAGILFDKFSCIKQNDFARLYSVIAIGKRVCPDREDYQLLLFIDV